MEAKSTGEPKPFIPVSIGSDSLFHRAFGFSSLGVHEIVDITKKGAMSKTSQNLFSADQNKTMEQTHHTIAVLNTVKSMLRDESVAHREKDVKKTAQRVYKNFIKDLKLDQQGKAQLAKEIDSFIVGELGPKAAQSIRSGQQVQEAVQTHQTAALMKQNEATPEHLVEKLLVTIRGEESNYNSIGGDFVRYLSTGRVRISDSTSENLIEDRRRSGNLSQDEAIATDFGNCLGVFLEKLGHSKKSDDGSTEYDHAAMEILEDWQKLASVEGDLQGKLQVFFNKLFKGDLGPEGTQVAKLLLGFYQNLLGAAGRMPSLAKLAMPPEVSENLFVCKSSASISYQFPDDGTIKLTCRQPIINSDHPRTEVGKANLVECRYQIVPELEMSSPLTDLHDWNCSCNVAIGHLPEGEEDGKATLFLESLDHVLKTGGFQTSHFTCEKEALV
jgi:hypothetical protein